MDRERCDAKRGKTIVAAMRCVYADVMVVAVTAPPEILAGRLAARARGSDGAVAERLRRAVDEAAADVAIVNVGSAEEHARHLLRAIRGV